MDRMTNIQEPFFRKMVRPIPNKNQINNTPIRQRDHNKQNKVHNQHHFKQINHKRQEQEDSINPYINESSVANSRTVPKRRTSLPTRACVNHLDTEAEFKIQIDGESLNYCSKCAAHLASNGFKVERIIGGKSPRRIIPERVRSPAYSKRRQQLAHFIEELKNLEAGYQEREEQVVKTIQSHEIEKQTITNFYSSMFEYLEYIKDEHLNYLEEEASRNVQIGEIQADEIGQTMEELKAMREDIESNVDKIVQEVDENSYKECMTFYSQKKEVHQHRLSELGVDLRPANCTTADCVEEKLSEFKGFIDELTGIMSSKADSMY